MGYKSLVSSQATELFWRAKNTKDPLDFFRIYQELIYHCLGQWQMAFQKYYLQLENLFPQPSPKAFWFRYIWKEKVELDLVQPVSRRKAASKIFSFPATNYESRHELALALWQIQIQTKIQIHNTQINVTQVQIHLLERIKYFPVAATNHKSRHEHASSLWQYLKHLLLHDDGYMDVVGHQIR